MKIVIAPDSFKGSLPADAVAASLAEGWRQVHPDDDLVLCPMADGGEGTLEAVATAVPGATRMPVTVRGPVGEEIRADWLLLPPREDAPDGVGVVELASTCGIELLGERREPWDASTFGFGQAVVAALDHGVSRLVLAIGSSASTDGGSGLLAALGARIMDAHGVPVPDGARGLEAVAEVDTAALRSVPDGGVMVLTDVTNPLLGPQGAAAVFGPQKGLSEADVPVVDGLMRGWASLLGLDPDVPGAGAAGGTGGALLHWGAELVPGADAVARLVGLAEELRGADLVLTGEGAYDGQSASGKAPALVTSLAGDAGVDVVLVAGHVAADVDTGAFSEVVSLTELAGGPEASMVDAARYLVAAGRALAQQRHDGPRSRGH